MTQLFLFTAQFLPWLTSWVGRWVWWLQSDGSVAQDDGYKVFTFDCLVSARPFLEERPRVGSVQ